MNVFGDYARYYDLLYQDKDYDGEAQFINGLIKKYAPNAKNLLELGCGTGIHAEKLAAMGYSVHGVDLSDAMLARAEIRKTTLPPEDAERLTFASGDVRTVQAGMTYDAVISLFHVMSYQTSNADLEAAFKTAASHLTPGGLFLFDFWYGPAVLTQRPEVRVKRLEDDHIKVTRIAELVMHVNENIVYVNYTVFIEEKETGKVEQLQETHQMRYLFLPELEQYQRGVFEKRASYTWMSSKSLSAQSWAGMQILVRVS